MSEVNYYQDGTVTITNARAVLGGKTYAMSNITSVAMGAKPANVQPGIVVALIGLAIAACSLSAGNSGAVGVIFGILVLVGGIALAVMAKASYIVRIGSASGETDGLVSNDTEYVQKIVNAVNEAIIKRG